MMFTPPERLIFDSRTDIIDYVSKGLPPTRKDFDKIIAGIRSPMTAEQEENAPANAVVIKDRLFADCDAQLFEEVLTRVYKNNVRNRNIVLGAAAVTGVVIIGCTIHNATSSKKESSK